MKDMNKNKVLANKMNLQLLAENTVKDADLARVRDVDFTERFVAGIETLMKMLVI